MDNRGISIAEGDILVLCIRLFSELLQGRYSLPEPNHKGTLLAQHSAHIVSKCSSMLASFPAGHKDEQFNNLILAQSEPAIAALGHAMAYSCAIDQHVPQPLLNLFECAIINMDPSWYVEHAGVSGDIRRVREDKAARDALPGLKDYINGLGVRPWITAPIVCDDAWDNWFPLLKTHRFPREVPVETVPVLARL